MRFLRSQFPAEALGMEIDLDLEDLEKTAKSNPDLQLALDMEAHPEKYIPACDCGNVFFFVRLEDVTVKGLGILLNGLAANEAKKNINKFLAERFPVEGASGGHGKRVGKTPAQTEDCKEPCSDDKKTQTVTIKAKGKAGKTAFTITITLVVTLRWELWNRKKGTRVPPPPPTTPPTLPPPPPPPPPTTPPTTPPSTPPTTPRDEPGKEPPRPPGMGGVFTLPGGAIPAGLRPLTMSPAPARKTGKCTDCGG